VNTLELLAPAGSPEALDAAIGEGADAVYLGLKTFNARLRSANFAFSQFEAAVQALHKAGKRIYTTVNTVFEERETDRMYQFLEYLSKIGPDAIIVQDLGVAALARKHFPALRLHASTQMNVSSAKGVNQLSRMGFRRVVLSRELSIKEIAAVKAGSSLDLEVFAHGALCVSCSGLCLFSSFLGGKSANRGACAQACRRLYRTEESEGYFFSPDDLELVEHLPALAEAGVSSLKIEGRMKSAEYVGAVVSAYRAMLDGMADDPERALAKARAILQNDFARSKTSYFMVDDEPEFIRPSQAGGTGIALGKVVASKDSGEGSICLCEAMSARSPSAVPVAPGDTVRVHGARDGERKTARVLAVQEGPEGSWISLAQRAKTGDSVYVIQTKAMSKRYKPVLPQSLSGYRRAPGFSRAPEIERRQFGKAEQEAFPEGLYAATDSVAGLYVFQSSPPDMAILRLDRRSAADALAEGAKLPFRGKLAIELDPFFPEADSGWLEETIDALRDLGATRFIANNLGHFSLLRNKGLAVAAGEYLYAFNSRAADAIQEIGPASLVMPLEIAKQDLLRVAEGANLSLSFVTIFAYPALFRMRARLASLHGFGNFSSKEGEPYILKDGASGSVVVPGEPYSITDRRSFLEEAGFRRFIAAFSYVDLKKQLYREVMKAARESTVLQGTGRFNWKDGFWSPEPAGKDGDGTRRGAAAARPKRIPSGAGGGPRRERDEGIEAGEARSEGGGEERSEARPGKPKAGGAPRGKKPGVGRPGGKGPSSGRGPSRGGAEPRGRKPGPGKR